MYVIADFPANDVRFNTTLVKVLSEHAYHGCMGVTVSIQLLLRFYALSSIFASSTASFNTTLVKVL